MSDWNCGGTTGSTGGDGCAGGDNEWLSPGEHSPTWEDWDTFRVDGGWCYKVTFYLPYDSWTQTYDRRGQSSIWVKVEDHGLAVIKAQASGYCP